MARVISRVDLPLVSVIAALMLLGLYNLTSAGQSVAGSVELKQGIFMAIGVCIMVVVSSIDYRNLEGLAVPIFLGVVALLLLTSVAGKMVNGSRRWIGVGPFSLQTSDLAKLGVIIIVAKLFHARKVGSERLTLTELFRPMNVSRPLLVVVAVLMVALAGDAIKPAQLKKKVRLRSYAVKTIDADAGRVVVGSGSSADVSVRGSGVAAEHAVLTRLDDHEYYLEDRGSAGGTYVNGERISGTVQIHDGDVIRFGTSALNEMYLSARLEKIRPYLGWVALGGTIWLLISLGLLLRRREWAVWDLLAPIDVVGIPCALILVQPDLGTTLVVLIIAGTMILFVGLERLSLLLLTVFGTLSVAAAWFVVLKPYQKERVLNFLNPEADLAGAGYHQHQSLIAIGSGRWTGKGHGQGTQTQLSFLPEQQTDFIFSVWSEEHGFLGCLLVVMLFFGLIVLCYRVAVQAKDRFGALLVVGVTAMLFWHTVINMLMVIRMAPVVGVPLPLWSYGGSFLLTAMVGLGVVLNVGMRRYVF